MVNVDTIISAIIDKLESNGFITKCFVYDNHSRTAIKIYDASNYNHPSSYITTIWFRDDHISYFNYINIDISYDDINIGNIIAMLKSACKTKCYTRCI